jgi:hypothetical protein
MMSLPLPWVERIFLKLGLTFGRDFISRWEGIPLEDVKADWAHELSRYQQNPAAIKHALETVITGKPPSVQDFKAACMRYVPMAVQIEAPLADPEIVAAEIRKSKAFAFGAGNKDWAHALKNRHDAGDRLNPNQIRCYKNALKLHPNGVQL